MKTLCYCLMVNFALVSIASAGLVYDEGVDGDAGRTTDPISEWKNLGTLTMPESDIVGTVGNPDFVDFFLFTTTVDWTVDLVSVSADPPQPGTPNLVGFTLYQGVGLSQVGSNSSFEPESNLFGEFAPGIYGISMGSSNASFKTNYRVRINQPSLPSGPVVPEPGSMALMGLGLLGAGIVRVRRRK